MNYAYFKLLLSLSVLYVYNTLPCILVKKTNTDPPKNIAYSFNWYGMVFSAIKSKGTNV